MFLPKPLSLLLRQLSKQPDAVHQRVQLEVVAVQRHVRAKLFHGAYVAHGSDVLLPGVRVVAQLGGLLVPLVDALAILEEVLVPSA